MNHQVSPEPIAPAAETPVTTGASFLASVIIRDCPRALLVSGTANALPATTPAAAGHTHPYRATPNRS
jgi:hypothetical protein